MASNITELIIKVGNKKSSLSFSHSKAYRVVTTDELVTTSALLPDCHLLIIEGISADEYDGVRDFVKSYVEKDSNNRVWFYTEDLEEENINGLVDELDYDIFTTKESLFRDIFDKTQLNISTNINLIVELNNVIEEKNKANGDDPFSAFEIPLSTSEDIEKADAKDTKGKSSEAVTPEVAAVIPEVVAEEPEVVAAEPEVVTPEVVVTAEPEVVNPEPETPVSVATKDYTVTLEKPPVTESVTEQVEKPETTLKSTSTTVKVDTNTSNNSESTPASNAEDTAKSNAEAIAKAETLAKANAEALQKLESATAELSKLKVENSSLQKQISNLAEVNSSITERYDVIVNEYNRIIQTTDVLEDPITLSQYESLKNEIDSLNNKIKEQQDNSDRTIDSLNEQINDYHSQIDDLNAALEDSKKALESKQSQLVLLNDKISKGEIQSEELESARSKVKELQDSIESLNDIIKGQTNDINKLRERVDKRNERIEVENTGRQASTEFSNLLVKKLNEMSGELEKLKYENEQHKNMVSNLRSSDADNNGIIASQANEIIGLRKQLSNVTKQIDEAVKHEKYEKSLLAKQVEDLQEEIESQKEQISLMESQEQQYEISLNNDSYNSLQDDNNALKEINNALRTQLKASQDETELARKEKLEAIQTKSLLEDKITRLDKLVKANQRTLNGGGNGSIPALNYQGRGAIIPVFGCGSYGITTTAISLARRLATTSKVLFVDMDLIAPKADVFFGTPPTLKDYPGFNRNKPTYYTGMHLFFEQGIDAITHNRCVTTIEPLRRGGLDYFSGLYDKDEVDTVKITSADFTSLFNYFGNTYGNVVVDLGRIGSSDLTDSIIREICKIGIKSVGVTSGDFVDIRMLRMKMNGIKLNVNKVAVLINMCDTSKLDEKAARMVSPSLYGLMPFYPDMYGHRNADVFSDRKAKDRFDKFLNNAVFNH